MGYLKLNLASQSLRLSISILPRPCKHSQLSSPERRWSARPPWPERSICVEV